MNENEKHYFKIFSFVACILLLLVGYFIWQSGNLPDHGNGADRIRSELSGAGAAIDRSLEATGDAERRIERAETAIGISLEGIERVERSTTEVEGRLEKSLQLNRRGQSIIQQVRSRGPSNPE